MPVAPSFSSFPDRPKQPPAQDPAWHQGGLDASTSAVPVFGSFPERVGKIKQGKQRRERDRDEAKVNRRHRSPDRERERERDDQNRRKRDRRDRNDDDAQESRRRWEEDKDEERRRRRRRPEEESEVTKAMEVCVIIYRVIYLSL